MFRASSPFVAGSDHQPHVTVRRAAGADRVVPGPRVTTASPRRPDPRPRVIYRLGLALALALALPACTATAPRPVAPPAPAPAPSAPRAAIEPAPSLHWVRDSAEHDALFVQIYRLAADRLAERVEGRDPWTWAVSLDGDETVLDNSLYQKERADEGSSFTAESWDAWVRRKAAPALPGVREFLEEVRRLGGRIAIVTNRDDALCQATEDNLRSERLAYDLVLCKPPSGVSDKEPRWRAIENGTASRRVPPLAIVLWVGDNVRDFPGASQELLDAPVSELGHFGDDWFLLPNPMYGSWEHNPAQ